MDGEARRNGIKVLVQVGSVEEAQVAVKAGADAIIAQSHEAGGHTRAAVSLWVNLPAIADAVKPVPVLVSGGIATGRGVAAALMLGAQGVSMGTRFVATHEAFASDEYKNRVINARAEDTVYLDLFDGGFATNAPHRVIRNKIVDEWEQVGRPPIGARPGEGTIVGTVNRGAGKLQQVPRYYSSLVTPGYDGERSAGWPRRLLRALVGNSIRLVGGTAKGAAPAKKYGCVIPSSIVVGPTC